MQNNYCIYYQAEVERSKCWFMVAILRSFENIAFDRTLDKRASRVEFFVPQDCQTEFVALMQALIERGVIRNLQQLPNRLQLDQPLFD